MNAAEGTGRGGWTGGRADERTRANSGQTSGRADGRTSGRADERTGADSGQTSGW